MKVVMYMAMTVNGFIAREDDSTSFVSKTEWKHFDKISRKAGNIIIGRRTCEVCDSDGSFPFTDRLNVVVTKRKIRNKWKNTVFVRSPKEALKVLKNRKFNSAFVGGGGHLNASFMKQNLVDEIYLDVEPIILGRGVKLFSDSNFESKLKLLETKKLSNNEIQLRYKVLKK